MQTEDSGSGTGPGTGLGSRPQAFWLLVLGAVLTMQLELPFRLAGLALTLAAAWLGITVLVRLARARRQGRAPRRAWPIGVGLGLSAAMLLSLVVDAAFYPIVADRERCLAEANTRTAVTQCTDQLEDRLRRLRDRISSTR